MIWSCGKEIGVVLCLLAADAAVFSPNPGVGGRTMKLPNATGLFPLNDHLASNVTGSPTEFPTESPAPSPSPSEAPSNDPERITKTPSAYPTESPAPSPSPSEFPTGAPSSTPSVVPTSPPTVSSAPSNAPSAGPSDLPSDSPSVAPSTNPTTTAMPSDRPSTFPSLAPSQEPTLAPSDRPTASTKPSDMPSFSPSEMPSFAPSKEPSHRPSASPSSTPTYSPTYETQKTKSSVSEILLMNIDSEMDDMTLARFEVATLEFIRQAQPPSKGYNVEILAVTVLTQVVVFPDHYEMKMTDKHKKRDGRFLINGMPLNNTHWDVALEISFRTVGVVTSGRVRDDFDFDNLALYGFEKHFDQYLWQLGNSNDFFAPLKDISNWQTQMQDSLQNDQNTKSSKQAAVVMVVIFSLLASGFAFVASYYAVRHHLRTHRRQCQSRKSKGGSRLSISPKPNMLNYSGPDVINYLTNSTKEDSTYHDGDVEGGGAINFVKSIDPDDQSLESVRLTPRAANSPAASRRSEFFSDDDTSPLKSPVALQTSKKEVAATSGINFGLGGAQQTLKKWMTPRQSVERSNNAGENNNRSSTESRAVRFDPPEKEYKDSCSTPKKSIALNTKTTQVYDENNGVEIVKNKSREDGEFTLPISFFDGGGEDLDSDYIGEGTPMSSLAGSNASSFFNNIGKSFSGRRSSTGAPPSLNGVPANPAISENRAFSEASAKYSDAPSTVVNQKRKTRAAESESLYHTAVPNQPGPSSAVSDSTQASRVQNVVAQIHKRQMEAQKVLSPQPVPARKPFANPHEGFETILGARSRSMEEDDVVQNMDPRLNPPNNMHAPSSTPQSRRDYGYAFQQITKDGSFASTAFRAKPMSCNQEDTRQQDDMDNKSTLSNVMKRPGSYDVYAPSGPIGIVVDTSKHGPSVHSLKSTSPMLGLITAGDLIIALDNEDTRSLSAAELTRLMAKKSRQKERKITLYSVDGF